MMKSRNNLEKRILLIAQEFTKPKELAEAFIPIVLPYNHLKENREKFTDAGIRQKAILYANLVAGELVLDAARTGLLYLIHWRYFS